MCLNNEVTRIMENYVKWNKAFHTHFFHNKDDGEVFLDISEETINGIGKDEKTGNVEDFLNVMLQPREVRSHVFSEIYRRYVGRNFDNGYLNDRNLFNFAKCFLDNDLNTSHFECPFLNYIVLALYIVGQCQDAGENAIGQYLRNFVTGRINGEGGDYSGIEALFDKLHEVHPSFVNHTLTRHRYVGLLQYQLGLTLAQKESINEVLYCNQFELEEDSSYEEIIYKMIDYFDEGMKDLLRGSLASEPIKQRINDLIRSFDRHEYELAHQNNLPQLRTVGVFVHAICFSEREPKLVILTDVRNQPVEQEGYVITPEDLDSLDGYNPNHVIVNGNDRVDLNSNYGINTDNIKIKMMSNDGIIFFRRCNESYYVETKELCNIETFVAVRDQSINNWNQWVERTKIEIREEIPADNVEGVLGPGWTLFEVGQCSRTYYNINREIDHRAVDSIQKKGGIIPDNKKNVYLISALPYFEFFENIDKNNLQVCINIDNRNIDAYKLIIIKNRLIIDFQAFDLLQEHSSVMDVYIEYGQGRVRIKKYFSFSVCRQVVRYNANQFYKFNKWGENVTKDDGANHLMEGNNVAIEKLPVIQRVSYWHLETILNEQENIGIDLQRFYFINLLSACCFMTVDNSITMNTFKRCVRYAMTRSNEKESLDTKVVSYMRNLLVNTGYISPSYETQRYQAVPPAFHRVNIYDQTVPQQGTRTMFMLTGCYTLHFLNDLISYCTNNDLDLKIKTNSDRRGSVTDMLLPPIILVSSGFNADDFSEYTQSNFESLQGDLAYAILNRLPSIQEYENTLVDIQGEMNVELEPSADSFPRVRNSKKQGYERRKWIETTNGQFKRSQVRDFAFMELYCRYKRNLPMLLMNTIGEICIPRQIHFPYLLQRAMSMLNIGQPEYKKVFICNNRLTDDPLYSIVKIYKIGREERTNKVLINLLTGSEEIDNNSRVQPISNFLNYEINLWTRKNRFSLEERSFITVKKRGERCPEIIATPNKVFIRRDPFQCSFQEATGGTPNYIVSKVITTERGTWENLGIGFIDGEFFELPSKQNYNIEELTIK